MQGVCRSFIQTQRVDQDESDRGGEGSSGITTTLWAFRSAVRCQ